LAVKIDKVVLENACKGIIETIFFCLPDAHKGTVYRVGGPPEMIVTRITSGIIDGRKNNISWGLPQESDYNPPGKPWLEYRDEPGRVLEAMAWCVEKQKSWTAEDPKDDIRSVRLQTGGGLEDFHHMEPVLIRKADLYLGNQPDLPYPRTSGGKILWQDSDYVVAAVIKIHFLPNTIRIGSPATKVIKRLSRILGTELLSYQLRQRSLEAMEKLAKDKLNACNILADSLRNAITKSGLIMSLIKLELGTLRDQWEEMLLRDTIHRDMKSEAVRALNKTIEDAGEGVPPEAKELIDIQNKFLGLSLPPEQGESWVQMQIEERWKDVFLENSFQEEQKKNVHRNIQDLKKSLYLGKDPDILAAYQKMPDDLKAKWIQLLYENSNGVDFEYLARLIHILEDPSLNLPYQEKSKKSLIRLKALAEIIAELEESTNVVLREILNGYER
jgi:hypothetical protein